MKFMKQVVHCQRTFDVSRTGTIGVTGDAKVTLKLMKILQKIYTINYHQ